MKSFFSYQRNGSIFFFLSILFFSSSISGTAISIASSSSSSIQRYELQQAFGLKENFLYRGIIEIGKYPSTPTLIVSYRILSYPIVSYRILSYPIVSYYRIVSYSSYPYLCRCELKLFSYFCEDVNKRFFIVFLYIYIFDIMFLESLSI